MATWEDQAGSDSAFVSSFSNLDVNAPEFIPGQPFVYRSQPAPVALPSSNGDEVVVDEAPGPETQLEGLLCFRLPYLIRRTGSGRRRRGISTDGNVYGIILSSFFT